MANSDGQVSIHIETNAKEAAKELDNVDKSFKKNAETVKSVSTVYDAYQREIQENISSLREMALGGGKNSAEFQRLAQQTREYQHALNEANKSVDDAIGGMNKQNDATSKLISAGKNLIAGYIGIQGAKKAVDFALESVEAYRVQERAVIGLETALKNAGVYTQEYSKHLQNLASEIQSYSNYGDEAILKAQGVAQAFMGSVPITDALTKAVVDFAAAMDMDLEQAFTLVGKSVGSSTNALGRYGVELKKGMTDSQKMAAITKQLGDRYKGQAQQMANASTQLKNSIGDLKEAFGAALNGYVTNWQRGMRKMIESTTGFVNSIRIMRSEISSLDTADLEKRYKRNAEIIARIESDPRYSKKSALALTVPRRTENKQILDQIKHLREQALRQPKVTPIKFSDDELGMTSISDGSTKSTTAKVKTVKDAFQQAQDRAQSAEKAFKSALTQYGSGSAQVEAARKRWQDTKTAVDEVQKAFENLTAKGRTPFEQLNYNVEQARQKLLNLASADVVDLEKVRQAQAEFQTWHAQLQEVNQYLQPVTGAYQQLSDKVVDLTAKLRDLAAENKIGSADWTQYKNALDAAQTELDNVNKSLKDNGINIEEVSKNISSSISSGLISALRSGGNAFEAFSNLALSALQKVLDKMIEMAIVSPLINAFSGGAGGSLLSFFGFKDGAAFKNGNVIPFAKGGIVNKPTLFPMANGGTGLMGEAGAEAVMPLKRMSNGRLGVEAEKSGTVVNIYNQSQSQIETRKRDDGNMDIIIKRVNEALKSERTSTGFRAAYQREDRKGVQAV